MSATILLVDDDAEIRELLELLLSGEGYAVLQAESGEAALDLLEKGAGVDLIILDVMMPGLSGSKTCARIRETSTAARRRPRTPAASPPTACAWTGASTRSSRMVAKFRSRNWNTAFCA